MFDWPHSIGCLRQEYWTLDQIFKTLPAVEITECEELGQKENRSRENENLEAIANGI